MAVLGRPGLSIVSNVNVFLVMSVGLSFVFILYILVNTVVIAMFNNILIFGYSYSRC